MISFLPMTERGQGIVGCESGEHGDHIGRALSSFGSHFLFPAALIRFSVHVGVVHAVRAYCCG
jgi:hypothetical protein